MKLLVIDNPRPLTVEHYNDVANAPLSASLNSGYALAVARSSGWETTHFDFTAHSGDATSLAAQILSADADLILFHWVYSWGHEALVRDAMTLIRRESSTPMGAFGLFPTLAKEHLLSFAPALDFIMAGEFEATLVELLNSINAMSPIPGLLLRGAPFIPRPLIDDLAGLPVPDDVGSNCDYPSLNIAASRGCFGTCSFCFIHPYYGCSRRRPRAVDCLERELATRLARRPVESIYFIDPTFIGHGSAEHERVREIGRIAVRLRLPFGFETRVDTVDDDLLEDLAAHGANSVFLGIESGCDAVLQRIGKGIDTAQIRRAIGIVRRCGLRLNLGFIMFEPDTTQDELAQNYAFLDELGLLEEPDLTANLLYHNQIVLCGSPAWERFDSQGRLIRDDRLPFEARYRFRDERVRAVCDAMGRLATAFFLGNRRMRGGQTAGNGANNLLKEAFRTFITTADTRKLAEREAELTAQMQELF